MDLRQMGHPYEKKYLELNSKDRKIVTDKFVAWRQLDGKEYCDVPEFCHSATIEEIRAKDYVLVPSRYIEFVNRDENIDYDTKMSILQEELTKLFIEEQKSKAELLEVLRGLGYEIKLWYFRKSHSIDWCSE